MLIDITMFWGAYGNYLKYSVPQDAPLTKYNHKKFKKKEYLKLHKILNNPNSKYSNFTINSLTEKQAKEKYKVDVTTGSTIKLIFDAERIKGAVKTTHTLWNIANSELKSILIERTKNNLFDKQRANIYNIKLEEKSILSLENKISKEDVNRSISICNYLIKNGVKSKKANRFIKKVNFIK